MRSENASPLLHSYSRGLNYSWIYAVFSGTNPPYKIQTALYYDVVFFQEFHSEQYVHSVTLRFQSVPQTPYRVRAEQNVV
jgi:hypothetical protein